MKYITTKDNAGNEEIFLFPKRVHHDAMAEVLTTIRDATDGNWRRVARKPIAAGFVTDEGKCYGSSETLGLKSRAGDTALLAKQLKF